MATSIGQLGLALISAKNENTLTLANVNFDFSIVKVVPPTEFLGLGAALSSKRRGEAEDGPIHGVARKLAALFGEGLPNTPNLIKSYGTRATEIAQNSAANPKGTPQDGAFHGLVGADGTSIWAAATSGQNAIAIHLLACMLARIWSGPQATAIWVELVSTRKTILQKRLEGNEFRIEELSAAKIQLNRDQLAEWDASARSWLRSADTANKKKQTQLMLILNNLDLSVPSSTGVYESVLRAWHAALLFMEHIIAGTPQTVQSPAVLLALSAWHIYPDMAVLRSSKTTNVIQTDNLVCPGGIVTIGLQKSSPDNDMGISWSLPLSHLRYYGNAVQSTRSISNRSSRVTMEELLWVTFGCATKGWVANSAEDYSLHAKFVFEVTQAICGVSSLPPWLELLHGIASRYLTSDGEKREEANSLISFGRRRCHSFLSAGRESLPPEFDLTDPEVFLKLISGVEEKIHWIRQRFRLLKDHKMANHMDLNDAVIAYKPMASEFDTLMPMSMFEECHKCSGDHDLDLDATVPIYHFDSNREWASMFPVFEDEKGKPSDRRWIPGIPNTNEKQVCGEKLADHRRIASCAAQRSFDIELHIGEACAIFTQQPVLLADNPEELMSFRKEYFATWPTSPSSYSHTRPVHARFLPMVLGGSSEDSDGSGSSKQPRHSKGFEDPEATSHFKHHQPSAPPSISIVEWSKEPRSVQFRLGSTHTVRYCSSIASSTQALMSENNKGRSWEGFLKSFRQIPFLAQGGESSLTKQVREMSDIYIRELENLRQNYTTTDPEGHLGIHDFSGPCRHGWYLRDEHDSGEVLLRKIFGHLDSVAVYIRDHRDHIDLSARYPALGDQKVTVGDFNLPRLSIEEFLEALKSKLIDRQALARYILGDGEDYWSFPFRDHIKSLAGLQFASRIYSNLPGAEVELSVSNQPIHNYQWIPIGSASHRPHARSLSCIATFESGGLDINPDSLVSVMGMSTGNSLYIAQFLWSDPYHQPSSSIIRRAIGNVGKPGMAFLISPTNPKMRDPGYKSWRAVPHLDFDGKFEGNFDYTTMHLSFSGYELALDTGEHGGLDKDVYFLEAVVQVYDGDAWVADLDILTALSGEESRRYLKLLQNRRSCSHEDHVAKDFSMLQRITSIDTWIELLDHPDNACVVRAKGSWLARLAATVIGVQMMKPVVVASEEICWACVRNMKVDLPSTVFVC